MLGLFSRPATRTGAFRAFAGGACLLVLSSYLVLVSGMLDRITGRIVGEMLSTDRIVVSIPSISTDLFWRSSVDTVLVEGSDGLVVRVCDGRVRGALHGFLLQRSVREVTAGTLEITIPAPRQGGPHSTLVQILDAIDRGIVCSADSLRLGYGRIVDSEGLLLDSMSISASVARSNDGATVSAASAACWIRDAGMMRGNGIASLRDGIASSPGFSAVTPFGNLYLTGELRGADGGLTVDADGNFTTERLDLPLSASMDFEAAVRGSISAPVVTTSLRNGEAGISGMEIEFSADTAIAGLDGLALRGVRLSGPGAVCVLDGRFSPGDGSWDGSLQLSLENADPSAYHASLPEGDLSGHLSVSASGESLAVSGGSILLDLGNSSLQGVGIGSASLDASFAGSAWDGSAEVSSPGARMRFQGGGAMGADMIPSSGRGTLSVELDGIEAVPMALRGGLPGFRNLRADLQIEATARELSAAGDVDLDSLSVPGLELGQAGVSGSLALSKAGAEGSVHFDCGSVSAGGMDFSVSGDAELAGMDCAFSDLSVQSSGGLLITGSGAVSYGDTVSVSLSDLKASLSKLRLVTGGEAIARIAPGVLLLDTAVIQTPHGSLVLQGTSGPGGAMTVRVRAGSVDFSTLASTMDMPGGISGVGDFLFWASTGPGGLDADLTGRISMPTCGAYAADSITVSVAVRRSRLEIEGIYSWSDGHRSGLQGTIDSCWSGGRPSISFANPADLDLEVNRLGDWVFYALPVPLRTRGADISAHASYSRIPGGEPQLDLDAVAMADRLTVTSIGMPFSDVVLYITHHSADSSGFNTSLRLASVGRARGVLSAELLAQADNLLTRPGIRAYRFTSTFDRVQTSVSDFAALVLSGSVFAAGEDPRDARPELSGKIDILEGLVGMPSMRAPSGGGAQELPFDLDIAIRSNRGVWFRNSLADIELGVDLNVVTVDGLPTINGSLSSLRGKVHLLDRDFEITQGSIDFIPGNPPQATLSINAETTIRAGLQKDEYLISVLIQGALTSPVITLSGEGPSGELTQEDILALLAVGLTYGELQQIDTGAVREQLEEAAQGYLGRLLARSLREGIGLDELQLTPELLADSTSLALDVGKYLLPELFLSYTGDVFSTEPGTISAQYFFSRDLYVMGTTKSTLHGEQEPSLELHYTLRY